jgi:bifunctional ADP-heptose synthase (sugar kinase/adenylyltransferase)
MSRKQERIVVACGPFNPPTQSDYDFLLKCRQLGDWLIVGVNSDSWLQNNLGEIKNNHILRRTILQSFNCADEIFSFNDSDGTAKNLLKLIKLVYPHTYITFVSTEDMHDKPEAKIRGVTFQTVK